MERMERLSILSVFLALSIGSVFCQISDKEYALLPPVFEMDNFDRCMLLEDEALYCYMEFRLKPNESNISSTWRNIQGMNSSKWNYDHSLLRHSICVPFVCPEISLPFTDANFNAELAKCYSRKYENLGISGEIFQIHCQTNDGQPFDFYDLLVLVVLITYLVFIIFASLYERINYYKGHEQYEKYSNSTFGKVIACFSIPNNWVWLTSVRMTPEAEAFRAIQGVRFYNMFIVMCAHATAGTLLVMITDTQNLETFNERRITVVLSTGLYILAMFFVISSLLTTYKVLITFTGKLEKKYTPKTILWLIIYRYCRLTPPVLLIIALHSTLIPHMVRGPYAPIITDMEKERCRKNFWLNLLYINNQVNTSEMCFIESWSLAVDMHAYIVILIILYFCINRPKRLLWIIPLVWFAVTAVLLERIYRNEVYTFPLVAQSEKFYQLKAFYEPQGEWITAVASTIPNLPAALCGMLGGYLYYVFMGTKITLNKFQTFMWWILGLGAMVAVAYFPTAWMYSKNYYDTFWFSLPLWGLSSTLFCLSMVAALLGFSHGIGWIFKWILEWRPLHLLGRISYTTFLAQYPIIYVRIASIRQMKNVHMLKVLFESIELILSSLIVGFIMSLLLEQPTIALLNFFLKNKFSEKTEKDKKVK